jgi:pyrroline-5-carboxylate reductase
MNREKGYLKNKKIGFIGLGNMGEALLGGILEAGIVQAKDIIASDIDKAKPKRSSSMHKVNIAKDNREVAREGNIIIVAVKPRVIDEVLKEIAPFLDSAKLLISIAAGITTKHIENLAGNIPVVRIMPNILVKVKEGFSAFCRGKHASLEDGERARKIFAGVGEVIEVKEELMDAVTALSGSGPAYIFLIVEILRDIGIKMGLSKEVAAGLINQTVFGSAKMLLEEKEDPSLLRNRVTSPRGTTERALEVLKKRGIENIFTEAIEAARDRARELSR